MRVLHLPATFNRRAVERRALALPCLFSPLLALMLLAFSGCNSDAADRSMLSASQSAVAPQAATQAPTPAQPPAVARPVQPAAAAVKPLAFGAAFEPGPVVSLSAVLANPGAFSEQSIITEGHVQRACSRRGCWMEIGEGDAACRVTFKDYGFFVPTDSAGSHARLQGKLSTKEIPAAQVAHLESEGARFAHRRPDGGATEVQLIASAVELTR